MLGRARVAARILTGRLVVSADAQADMGPDFHRLLKRAGPYTMTSRERMFALYEASRYVSRAGIDGDVVECGVWRGGSTMLTALALRELGDEDRTLWLYDTFAGMPAPGDYDLKWSGESSAEQFAQLRRNGDGGSDWAYAPLDDVQANMRQTGYPGDRLRYVTGKVEDTIPSAMPDRIALLRLDTDWYESTRHELEHLWPRLQPGGVLIIDDYGHWQGARRAVDEFFADHPVLLHRIDHSARSVVKG